MAVETVAANGALTGVKKGKRICQVYVPDKFHGAACIHRPPMRAYIQDWSLDASLNYQDVTPMGVEDKVEIFDQEKFRDRQTSTLGRECPLTRIYQCICQRDR
jgi:hypothetical protein